MKYKIQAKQTIYKYFEIDADNSGDALEKAQDMLCEGDVRFDDEPFMKMEVDMRRAATRAF